MLDECKMKDVFQFGTKAETLDSLRSAVKSAKILKQYHFSVQDWAENKAGCLDEVQSRFGDIKLVVRSSAQGEDGGESSMAGAFLSTLNIDGSNRTELEKAIDDVAASMTDNPKDQILVQEMASDITVCGVMMTYDIVHGAPYYFIEYDDETGTTDGVTSGKGVHKSLFVYRDVDDSQLKSARIRAFVELARELETLCNCAALDIEFALDKDGNLYLFQVRRIVLARNWHPVTERRVKRQLQHVEAFIDAASRKKDNIVGDHTILAVMPDWNPAEIIGTTPRPLAASLYHELITEYVWCHARAAMGYRDLGDTSLMAIINHHPYIDVRNSFNSFLPAGLDDSLVAKLVNSWLARFKEYPEFHDKIEFEIVPTCMDFCFDETFKSRYGGLLTEDEFQTYRQALVDLTREALSQKDGNSLDQSLANAQKLDDLGLPPINEHSGYGQLSRAAYLISKCKSLGTLPFSIAARHGFIAEALLRTSVQRGGLSAERLTAFKRCIQTVSGNMLNAYSAVFDGDMPQESFFKTYGHLRPGTYEITSLRYDERDDLFMEAMPATEHEESASFTLTDQEKTAIENLLAECGLDDVSAEDLLSYATKAIAAREEVKFIFSRSLSDALSHIVKWGQIYGLSRDDLSYIDWPSIAKGLYNPMIDDQDRFYLDIADEARRSMEAAHAFHLGHIVFGVRDIYVATLNRSVPNFIGLGQVSGHVVQLNANTPTSINLKDCIVCIENADPGFDWIFTKGIAGLVTCFGGANSHMAVRSAEFGLPAAIGCGDQLYKRMAEAGQGELNCAEQILRPLYGG